MATAEQTRSITIDLSPRTASLMEELAAREHRSVGEIVDSAVEAYRARREGGWLNEIGAYADSLNSPYNEEDVARLIREARSEEAAEHASNG